MKLVKIKTLAKKEEPLEVTEQAPQRDIKELFGMEGPLAKKEGYQPREGQIEFACAVNDAINNGRHLLAEAGTGSGKSYGYLAPIIANHRGKRAIIVTANIALQEQIFRKDLPALRELLEVDFSYALAKGFSNYICRFGIEEADIQIDKGKVKLPLYEQEVFGKVKEWVEKTTTGDISDFEVELPFQVKKLVTTSTEECYGKECPYFTQGCFPKTEKKKFRAADIVVTNYTLYFLDMVMRMTTGGEASILPDHEIVVFDEGHTAVEICRNLLAEQVSLGSIRAAADCLDARDRRASRLDLPRQLNLSLQTRIHDAAEAYFQELVQVRKDKEKYEARINYPGMVGGEELAALLFTCAQTYITAASIEGLKSEARNWLIKRANLCKTQASVIEGARLLEDEFNIFYIDLKEQKDEFQKGLYNQEAYRAVLNRMPAMPSGTLRKQLFENETQKKTVIACSATLANGSKETPFAYTARKLGVNEYDQCIAESPFDFSKTAFIVPSGIPDPNTKDENFRNAVCQHLMETIEAARGRTLGLFTSYDMLNHAYDTLKETGCPYTIFKQGDLPRTTLIQRFKEDEESVLLGTESFWTGVDVPGNALLAVFIDKLPFARMDDPYMDFVRMKEPEKWFNKYSVPEMVIKMKQGVGRLVRSINDRGIIVCCDKRVLIGRYAKTVRNSLPYDMNILTSMTDAAMYCWPE